MQSQILTLYYILQIGEICTYFTIRMYNFFLVSGLKNPVRKYFALLILQLNQLKSSEVKNKIFCYIAKSMQELNCTFSSSALENCHNCTSLSPN